MAYIWRFPIVVTITILFSGTMLLPAIVAFRHGLTAAGQAYVRSAIFITIVAVLIGFLTMRDSRRESGVQHLLTLVYVFTILPFILAIPLPQSLPNFFYTDAVFEMLSALTTTGATLVPFDPEIRYIPMLIYSASVSWLGAFVFLLLVFSVLEPLNIGGFELVSDNALARRERGGGRVGGAERLEYYFRLLAPAYLLITGLLMVLLLLSGERFLYAVVLAFSTIATSGITPYEHLGNSDAHLIGEFAIFAFLSFALSYHYLVLIGSGKPIRIDPNNPELRVTAFILILSLLVFAIFFVSEEIATHGKLNVIDFFRSMWGMVFTAFSFLTTHGYISEYWQFNVTNIEVHASSTYLVGLAMLGGGVATTAGGIKLLRIYAVYSLTRRELGRMVDPHSIAASGRSGRHLRKRGGINALIFMMLFIAGVSTSALFQSLTGLSPEQSLIAAISAATNCGPVLLLLPDHLISIEEVNGVSRFVYSATMVFGRVEVFVLLAFLNPEFWRNIPILNGKFGT